MKNRVNIAIFGLLAANLFLAVSWAEARADKRARGGAGKGIEKGAPSQSMTEAQLLGMFFTPEELTVSTAARSPRKIGKTAEKITVIDRDDIRRMKATSVADILARVPGVFVNGSFDYISGSQYNIQGSFDRHVRVLVDGVDWNNLADGNAVTTTIPAGIVDRIEILQGPASSAWGSALGGVIQIFTKAPGVLSDPHGEVNASVAEGHSGNLWGEVYGKSGPVGYYLFADRAESDGLRPTRSFERDSLFGRFGAESMDGHGVDLFFGYSDPRQDVGDFPDQDFGAEIDNRELFGRLAAQAPAGADAEVRLTLWAVAHDLENLSHTLGMGAFGPAPAPLQGITIEEERAGADLVLDWSPAERHQVTVGAEYSRGELDQTQTFGPALVGFGAPDRLADRTHRTRWALFASDALSLGAWTVTPGLRYDHDSVAGGFLSPSLGAARPLGEGTILRFMGARGFADPFMAGTSLGGWLREPNPDLDRETVWSAQAGVETGAIPGIWARLSFFLHEMADEIQLRTVDGVRTFVNREEVTRAGGEAAVETVPWHGFSVGAGIAYIDIDPPLQDGAEEIYKIAGTLRYTANNGAYADLAGRYVWWDSGDDPDGDYDDPVWDLAAAWPVPLTRTLLLEPYLSIHNLFGGDSYGHYAVENPERWAEAGVRFAF